MKENKKKYERPKMQVFELKQPTHLLQSSLPQLPGYDDGGNPFTD